jgi:hypothetical protein
MVSQAISRAENKHLPLDTDNKDKLVLSWNVVGTILLGETSKTDLLALGITVFLDVLLSTLEDDATLLLLGLLIGVSFDPKTKNPT